MVFLMHRCGGMVDGMMVRWSLAILLACHDRQFDHLQAFQLKLKRAVDQPSESLQKMIFPFVDAALDGMVQRTRAQDTDMAAEGFLRLLKFLRVVILQDSITMKNRCSHWRIWSLSVFTSPLYVAFAEQSMRENTVQDPTDLAIETVVPTIAAALENLQNSLHGSDEKHVIVLEDFFICTR